MKVLVVFALLVFSSAQADDAVVAVAANFQPVLVELVERFEQESGHRLTVVSGSTGKLYAQILHGAPFDILLAADQHRPRLLAESDRGVGESLSTYAVGRLALITAAQDQMRADVESTLAQAGIRNVAIANPSLAPYGVAASEVLEQVELQGARTVIAENVGQAYAMVATGNADIGLVALSLARAGGEDYLEVPASMHGAIRQDGILLARGRANAAAIAFMAFLQQDEARRLILAAGFGSD